MKRIVLGALVLGGLAAPALAQQYYVERDPGTRECRVVETTTVIEPRLPILGRIFGNRAEAESQVEVLCDETDPAPVVIERDRDDAVVIDRDRDPVVIERDRDAVVIDRDRDRDDDAVVIERDDGPVVIERD